MQLKMSKPFNQKLARQLLQRENEFIAQILSKAALPVSGLGEQRATKAGRTNAAMKGKIFRSSKGNAKRAQTFEELHAKLEGLRNVKRLGYKEKQLKKGLKNKLKKATKREDCLRKKKPKTERNAPGSTAIEKEDCEAQKIPRPKPVFNSEGKMVFSKFDFSEIGAKKLPKAERDPKRILLQLKERKEKLRAIERRGETEKAQLIKEKEAWRTVLAKAGGEKVKDDPDLLRRTIRRSEQRKKSSARKWESRLENVQKGLRERQEKRQDNITKKKKERKVNKLRKAAKKGRIIPGF